VVYHRSLQPVHRPCQANSRTQMNVMLCADCGSGEGGGLQDTPIEVVHLLLSHLLSPAESDSLGVSSEQKDAFFRTLTKGSDWLVLFIS